MEQWFASLDINPWVSTGAIYFLGILTGWFIWGGQKAVSADDTERAEPEIEASSDDDGEDASKRDTQDEESTDTDADTDSDDDASDESPDEDNGDGDDADDDGDVAASTEESLNQDSSDDETSDDDDEPVAIKNNIMPMPVSANDDDPSHDLAEGQDDGEDASTHEDASEQDDADPAPHSMKIGAIESELRKAKDLMREANAEQEEYATYVAELESALKRANSRLKALMKAVKKSKVRK